MPGWTPMKASISAGFLRTSLRRSASLRSGLATIASICARVSVAPSLTRSAAGPGAAQPAPRQAVTTVSNAWAMWRMKSSSQARFERGDALEQIERQGDARRVELEVARQPHRQAHARQRAAAEAPFIGRTTARLEDAFDDPELDLLRRRVAGPAQLDRRPLHFLFDDAAAQRGGDRSVHGGSPLQMNARLEIGKGLGQVFVSGARRIAVGLRRHDGEHRVEIARVLAGQAAALQAELAARARTLRHRELNGAVGRRHVDGRAERGLP